MGEQENKRGEERVPTVLPVDIGGASGLTRDVSASGIFFETDARLSTGASIRFTVQFTTPAGNMTLKCQGEIVRVEPQGPRVGVAVKIIDSSMELA